LWSRGIPLNTGFTVYTLFCCLLNQSATDVGSKLFTFIIIFSGSRALVRTSVASHWRFRTLFRHLLVLHWTSHQPVAKASTYTGQHNVETQRQTFILRAGFEPMIPVTKRQRPTPYITRPPGQASNYLLSSSLSSSSYSLTIASFKMTAHSS
jgi:hypothetical protein